MTERLAQFGRYRITEEIGKGSFATVYKAMDTRLEGEVALKVLHPALLNDRIFVQNFSVKARTFAKLRHPHIITIYDIAEIEGHFFIAMELASGASLAETIAKQGRITWTRTLRILQPICDALDYTHSLGIVHRDLKPSNILLDPQQGPLLSDFGFADLLAGNTVSMTIGSGIVGTPSYIAPEVWEQNDDKPSVDIYALGCVVYEMLTGDVLFKGQTPMQSMRAHDRGAQFPDTWPPDVPDRLAAVLNKALARNPAARYPNAMALWNALNDLQVTEYRSPVIPEQKDVLQRLITLKQRRLDHLRLQAAPYGNRAEPSVLIEIEDLESEIIDLRGNTTELVGRSRAVGGQGITWHKPAPVVKSRRLDAALPREALFNERVDLIVQVRFPNSKPLGEKDIDWPLHSKPAEIAQTSEKMGLKFNTDPWTGMLEPAHLEVVFVSPDFTIEGNERRRIEVPPDEYSKRVVFLLTPRRIGRARVNIEVYNLQRVYLGTIAVETEITGAVVAEPIVVVGNILLAVEVAPLPKETAIPRPIELGKTAARSRIDPSASYSPPESARRASIVFSAILILLLIIIPLIIYFLNR